MTGKSDPPIAQAVPIGGNNEYQQYQATGLGYQQQAPYMNQQQAPYMNQQQAPYMNQQQAPYMNQQQAPYMNQQQAPYMNQQQAPYMNQQQPQFLQQQQQQQQQTGMGGFMSNLAGGGGGGGAGQQPAIPQQLLKPGDGGLMGAPEFPAAIGGFSLMDGVNSIAIKQRPQLAEALADNLGLGCIEFRNKYDMYNAETGMTLMYVEEQSGMLCRACCKPNHTLQLHVQDTRPGVPPNTPAMVVDRPFVCGGCPAFADICKQKATAVLPTGEVFATNKMPTFGGGFTPTIEVMGRNLEPIAKTTGPQFIVGGLLAEMSGDLHFNIYPPGTTDTKNVAPLARISKKKPASMSARLQEFVGDSDMYMVEFAQGLESEKKMTLVSTALLLEFMLFENGASFQVDPFNQSCTCNLFTCYCFGCICPCTLTCGGNQNSDGGE